MLEKITRFSVLCAVAGIVTMVLMVAPWMASMGSAQDVLILDKDKNTVISGVITEVDDDSFTLHSNNNDIEVSIDKMELDGEADTLLSPGMEVAVQGKLNNNIFEADRVEKISDKNTTPQKP